MVRRINFLLWRIIAAICLLAWIIVFVFEYHFLTVNGNVIQGNDLFTPLVSMCIHAVMILGSVFLVIFPTKFVVYGFLCMTIGLLQIIEGGGLPGIFMFFLGMLFFNKTSFFKKNRIVKITVLLILLFLGMCSQYRYGSYKLVETFLHLFSIALMCFLAYALYLPDLRIRKKDPLQKKIRLSSDKFTVRDVSILTSIQQGEKYEAIAKNENIALSTLKVRVRLLFDYLQVNDKDTFLIKYLNNSFTLE